MEKKILVIGMTGMLGHTVFTELLNNKQFIVFGTTRSLIGFDKYFTKDQASRIINGVDVENNEGLLRVFGEVKPDVVINCVGLIKQRKNSQDPLPALSLNAVLPHRLYLLCQTVGARFIQVSTDCVFDGKKGMYTEDDSPTAPDVYGMTKYLGEVKYGNAVTLRTSIIGHELENHQSLVDWFMVQKGKVSGYKSALFSGFPTVELARIMANYVIPNQELKGLYQVSASPINKFDLLKLIAKKYGKEIIIEPNEEYKVDKSLDSSLFKKTTGYSPPSWEELIEIMHRHYKESPWYTKE